MKQKSDKNVYTVNTVFSETPSSYNHLKIKNIKEDEPNRPFIIVITIARVDGKRLLNIIDYIIYNIGNKRYPICMLVTKNPIPPGA